MDCAPFLRICGVISVNTCSADRLHRMYILLLKYVRVCVSFPFCFHSAAQRMQAEVFDSEIFTKQRSQRPDFDKFLRSKVHAIAGELTHTDCGTKIHLSGDIFGLSFQRNGLCGVILIYVLLQ